MFHALIHFSSWLPYLWFNSLHKRARKNCRGGGGRRNFIRENVLYANITLPQNALKFAHHSEAKDLLKLLKQNVWFNLTSTWAKKRKKLRNDLIHSALEFLLNFISIHEYFLSLETGPFLSRKAVVKGWYSYNARSVLGHYGTCTTINYKVTHTPNLVEGFCGPPLPKWTS